MRVLHLSSEKSWRGGEQQIAYLVEELLNQGVDCRVACRRNTPFETFCQRKNIPHIALPFANQFDFYTAWRIREYCRKEKIDLLHVHSSHSHAVSVWAGLLGNNTPIILSRRVDFHVNANWLSAFKYNYSRISRVICVSDKIREIVSQSLRHPEKCITIHSGIDLSRFSDCRNHHLLHQEFSLDPHIRLVGNISAIAPHKDYFTFTDTAAAVLEQEPDVRFMIIGDGPSRSEIEDYVKQKNLQHKIFFTGFRNNIPALLPELDIFLITSETEGLGTTILDAFACHVPVVATRAGGIPEIVIHEQTGLLAPVKNSAQLAAHVLQLLREPEKKQALVSGAWQHLQAFTKENTARQTLQVYHEVLAE